MPTITKLAPEAVQAIRAKDTSERSQVAAQYDALLANFVVGDWGDVLLDVDDERLKVGRRLKAAAARRGLAVRFRQRRDNRMRFQIVAADDTEAGGQEPPAAMIEETTPLPRRRPTATERYYDVLPRWMRDGRASVRPRATKRRTR